MTTQCDLNHFTSDIRVLELTECIRKHHSTFQIGLNNSILKTSFTVYSPFYAVAVMPLRTTRHFSGHECMEGGGNPVNSSLTELESYPAGGSSVLSVANSTQSVLCVNAWIQVFLWAWKTGFV